LLVNDKDYLIDQNSTRTILAYSFSESGYVENPKNITIKNLGLNDSDLMDIALLTVNNVLIVTDGVKFVGIDEKNISNFWPIKLNETKIDY
jgi:hypothetical protein